MKKYVAAICLAITLNSYAQKITFSNLDLKGKMVLSIEYGDESGLLTRQTNVGDDESKNGYTWLNSKLEKGEFQKANAIHKGLNLMKEGALGLFVHNGNVYQICFRKENKTSYNLFVRTPFFNSEQRTDILTAQQPFFSVSGFNESSYRLKPDRVGDNFLLTYPDFRDVKAHNGQIILDKDFKVLKNSITPYIPPSDENYRVSTNYSLTGKYIQTSLYYSDKRNNLLKFAYHLKDFNTGDAFEINFPEIPECYYAASNSSPTEDGVINYGVFANSAKKETNEIKGVYKYETDFTQEKMISSEIMPLSKKGADAFEALRDDKGTRQTITNLIRMKDGSYFMVGESYQEVGDASKGVGFDKGSNKYFNIFVFAFDADLNFQWSKVVERKEKITGIATGILGPSREGYGSLTYLPIENTIHIYYNDDKKVFDYSLTTSGEEKQKELAFGDKTSVTIFPRESYCADEKSIFIPCLKDGKSEIMKIEY